MKKLPVVLAGLILACVSLAHAQTENVYSFYVTTPSYSTGYYPSSGLLEVSNGTFYGVTTTGGLGYGTVFHAASSVTPLYAFTGGNDGATPQGPLIMDASGNLYGTTLSGGAYSEGVVFELSPPVSPSTVWTETTLHAFTGTGGDGYWPNGGLTWDASGNLYGTTSRGGANIANLGIAFQLVPPGSPGGAWTENILHNFTGSGSPKDGGFPLCAPTMGSGGVLYGTTEAGGASNGGTAYSLQNVSGAWVEEVLYSFSTGSRDGGTPYACPVIDASGNLWGTTSTGGGGYSGGTVYELTPPTPPATAWTETIIHIFTGGNGSGDGEAPYGPLIMTNSGNTMLGTTALGGHFTTRNGSSCMEGCGIIFKLTNTGTTWLESIIYEFLGSSVGEYNDGSNPNPSLVIKGNYVYGTTSLGGSSENCNQEYDGDFFQWGCGTLFNVAFQ